MSNFLLSAGAIVVLLSVVILVHEWGHLVVARLCGVRVDVFSIGMGPRVWGVRRGATDYRLSALPIGGYVRMAGDAPTEERAGAPDELLSKKRWQRALISMAGPTMNVVLAVVVASGMLLSGRGEPNFLQNRPEISTVAKGTPAQQAGLHPGDVLLAVDGKAVHTWDDIRWETMFVAPDATLHVVVQRGERRLSLNIDSSRAASVYGLVGYPVLPVVIDSVKPGSPAEKDGLKHGDRVISVNGNTAVSPALLSMMVEEFHNKPIAITVMRDGTKVNLVLHPTHGEFAGQERWYIGAYFETPVTYRAQSFSTAIRGGVRYNVLLAAEMVNTILKLVEHKVKVKQLMGPVGIAQASEQAAHQGLLAYLNLIAFISLDLAIVNLLPIPILDGWNLLTLAVEGTLRRDLSLAVKERALQVGVIFLLLLILLVTYNDILRIVTGNH